MNKKRVIQMIVVASLAMFQASWVKAGTGVGGGGPDDHAQRLEAIKKRLMRPPFRGMPDEIDGLKGWCRDVSSVLQEELNHAKRITNNTHDREKYDLAYNILLDTLYEVDRSLEVNTERGGPLTKELVERGILLADYLKNYRPREARDRDDANLPETRINFIEEYIQFIIDSDDHYDQQYYIPYHFHRDFCQAHHRQFCHECCKEIKFEEAQLKLVEFERSNLNFALKFLTFKKARACTDEDQILRKGSDNNFYGKGYVMLPEGHSSLLIKVAALVSSFAATQLSSNLWADAVMGEAYRLDMLAQELESYLKYGPGADYLNDEDALWAVYGTFKRVMPNLKVRVAPCEESAPACPEKGR